MKWKEDSHAYTDSGFIPFFFACREQSFIHPYETILLFFPVTGKTHVTCLCAAFKSLSLNQNLSLFPF